VKTRTLLPVFCLALGACMSPQGEMNALADERLSLAPEVAWYKYRNDLPLYDAPREATVLRETQQLGRLRGISEETTRRLFSVQMEASRRIQWEYFHAWRKGVAVPQTPPRDLRTDLRPRIDAINRRQVELLARGAQPPDIAQLSEESVRFLPKN
jgi:chorismate mutase